MDKVAKQNYLALSIKDFTNNILGIDDYSTIWGERVCINKNKCTLAQDGNVCPYGEKCPFPAVYHADKMDMLEYMTYRTQGKTTVEKELFEEELRSILGEHKQFLNCIGVYDEKANLLESIIRLWRSIKQNQSSVDYSKLNMNLIKQRWDKDMDRKYVNEIIVAIVSGKSEFSELEFYLGNDTEDWNIVLKRLEGERDKWLVKKLAAEMCNMRDDEADSKYTRIDRLLTQAREHVGKRVPNPDGDGDVVALPKEIYERMLPNERVGYCVLEDSGKVATTEDVEELPERAKKAFELAINAGLMEKTLDGFKWLYGGNKGKARLGYFIKQVYNPDGYSVTPFKMLERLFGVTGLHTAQQQALAAKKPQKWRNRIDEVIASID